MDIKINSQMWAGSRLAFKKNEKNFLNEKIYLKKIVL